MHNFQNVCISETIHHSSYHSPQFKYMNFCHKIMCQPFWLLCKWLLNKTYQTSSIKNSNFLLYSSISVKLNFINILNCRKCWLKIDWKQLVTIQLHAPGPFNTNPLCKVDTIFWRGYESNDVNSPILSWTQTKSPVRVTKSPRNKGKCTFLTHILIIFLEKMFHLTFDLYFLLNWQCSSFKVELLTPLPLQKTV